MTKRQFAFIVIFFLFLYSCSDTSSDAVKRLDLSSINNATDSINYFNRSKYFGVSLINSKTGGTGFTDSSGATYQFRSIQFRIINDTVIPVSIDLFFSNKPYNFSHSKDTKFKAFLLPDTINGFGTELNVFLNRRLEKPAFLKKVIQPKEICIVNVGMLFYNALGRPDGFTSEEVFFKGQNHRLEIPDTLISLNNKYTKSMDIMLGVTLSSHATYYATVSCGRLLFLKQS